MHVCYFYCHHSLFAFKNIKKFKVFYSRSFTAGLPKAIAGYFRSDVLVYFCFLSLYLPISSPNKKYKKLILWNVSISLIRSCSCCHGVWEIKLFQEHLQLRAVLLCHTCNRSCWISNPWNLNPTIKDRASEANFHGLKSPFEAEADKYFRNQILNLR